MDSYTACDTSGALPRGQIIENRIDSSLLELYRQMYANTGIANESAAPRKSERMASLLSQAVPPAIIANHAELQGPPRSTRF